MTDTPWTPGPWRAHQVYTKDSPTAWTVGAWEGGKHRKTMALGVKGADARLIAAAPEMAELLEEGLAPLEGGPEKVWEWAGLVAIRKAKIEALLARIRGA